MEPYELDRVHRGEALSLLRAIPDSSIDALLTDPPYCSGGATLRERQSDPLKKYVRSGVEIERRSFQGDNRDGRSWRFWSVLWLSECHRILREGAFAATFIDWRQLPLATDAFQAGGFIWRGIIVWDKTEAAHPQPGRPRNQCEYVVWGTKGPAKMSGSPHPGVIREHVRPSDKHHLTGKPTDVMRKLARMTKAGGVILDPFAGSGTTIVAAILEGRRAIGFEVDEYYAAAANERIAGLKTA